MEILTDEQFKARYGQVGLDRLNAVDKASRGEKVAPAKSTQPKSNVLKDIGNAITTRFGNAKAAIQGTAPESVGEPTLVRGLQATAQPFGLVSDAIGGAFGLAGKATGLNNATSETGVAPNPFGNPTQPSNLNNIPTSETLNTQGQKAFGLSGNPEFDKKILAWSQSNPEAAKTLDSVLKGVGATGEIANNILAVEGGAQLVKGAANSASGARSVISDTAGNARQTFNQELNLAKSDIKNAVGKINPASNLSIDDEALAIVRKPQTQAYQKLAAEEGRFVQEDGLLGRRKINPDASEKAMAEAVKPLIEEGKINSKLNIIEQQKVIDDEARVLNAQLKSELNNPANNKVINRADLDSRFDDLKSNRDIELQSEPSAERAYNAVVKKFKSFVRTDDTAGLFDARQRFDAYMRKNYPGAFRRSGAGDLTPTNSAINSAFYDIRNSVNDIVGDALPTYKPTLARESGLINAADNIGYRELVGTGNSNRATRLFRGKTPTDKLIQAAIIGGAGTAAGAVGVGVVNAASGK